jgi:glyoxylase-like metal-dependent hydrolase (beta-lactamase superfamily II)
MRIDGWQIDPLLEGTFLLDGGSMFGVVPRALWSRHHPPDDQGRIVMALRCLLLRGHGRCILVDTGIGDRFDDAQQAIYQHTPRPGGLPAALAALGLGPGDVSDVVVTHLHFDHAAGLLAPDGRGGLGPAFPRARVHLQEAAWRWAQAPSPLDQASFFHADLARWEADLDLRLLRGDAFLEEGLRAQVTGGHTPGHQIVVVGEGEGALVFPADLIPTATHVRLPWIMAYDHQPLLTLDEKKVLLAQAMEEGWCLVFEHDPRVSACRLEERDGRVVPGEPMDLQTS